MSTICSAEEEELCTGRKPWRPPDRPRVSTVCLRKWRIVGTFTSCSAVFGVRRTVRAQRGARDLGHFENLVGNRHIVASKHCLQLVRHLRHRVGESRNHKNDVSNLLHGAPQNPHLRPLFIKSQRLGSKHVAIVVHPKVLRACRPGGEESSGPWSCSSRPSPLPWPLTPSVSSKLNGG